MRAQGLRYPLLLPGLLALVLCGASAASLEAQSKFNRTQWRDLSREMKLPLMQALISLAKQREGVTIRLSAEYYVRELDTLINRYVNTNNQEALKGPVGIAWKTIVVMEGDWDNGEDPLDYAQKFMGRELFDTFRQMYPDKYQHLVDLHSGRRPSH